MELAAAKADGNRPATTAAVSGLTLNMLLNTREKARFKGENFLLSSNYTLRGAQLVKKNRILASRRVFIPIYFSHVRGGLLLSSARELHSSTTYIRNDSRSSIQAPQPELWKQVIIGSELLAPPELLGKAATCSQEGSWRTVGDLGEAYHNVQMLHVCSGHHQIVGSRMSLCCGR